MRIRPRSKKIGRGCRTTSPTTLIWLTRTITATNEERLTKESKTVSKMRETRGLKIKESELAGDPEMAQENAEAKNANKTQDKQGGKDQTT